MARRTPRERRRAAAAALSAPVTRAGSDAAEIFWAARRLSRDAGAVPAAAGRVRGPALGRTDLPRPRGIPRRPARAIADRPGLHRPPRTARTASSLGSRDGHGHVSIELTPLAEGPAAALLDALTGRSAHPAVHPGPAPRRPLPAIRSTLSSWPPPSASRPGARPGRCCRRRSRLCWRRACSASGREPAACSPARPSSARTSAYRRSGSCSRRRRAVRSAATSRPLWRRGLVQQGPPGPSGPREEYSFRHILIQEAAYRAIPKSLRAELHHRFADWLEYVLWEPVPQPRGDPRLPPRAVRPLPA